MESLFLEPSIFFETAKFHEPIFTVLKKKKRKLKIPDDFVLHPPPKKSSHSRLNKHGHAIEYVVIGHGNVGHNNNKKITLISFSQCTSSAILLNRNYDRLHKPSTP